MAVLNLDKRMVFWDVALEGVKGWNNMMNNVIASIQIDYEVNKPTKAFLVIFSINYIEDVFTVGRKVKIYMGFNPTSLNFMFEGVIMKAPTGSAQDYMSYTVEILSKEIYWATIKRNISYLTTPYKDQIISSIAAKNGYLVDIALTDILPLKKDQIPMQRNKTDLEFLEECAIKWKCVYWFSSLEYGVPTLYFYDESMAYVKGNTTKTIHIDDVLPIYQLGYRTDILRNNVAKVNWKFKKKRNGNPGASTLFEFGDKEQPEDYVISFRGQRWELRKEVIDAIKRNPANGLKALKINLANGVGNVEATVRKYFRVAAGNSRTNKQTYKDETIDLKVDLNIGDPYLRPPRTASLISGSLDPKAVSAYLPEFLYEGDAANVSLFRIKKVSTKLDAGKINTQITLTRRLDGQL